MLAEAQSATVNASDKSAQIANPVSISVVIITGNSTGYAHHGSDPICENTPGFRVVGRLSVSNLAKSVQQFVGCVSAGYRLGVGSVSAWGAHTGGHGCWPTPGLSGPPAFLRSYPRNEIDLFFAMGYQSPRDLGSEPSTAAWRAAAAWRGSWVVVRSHEFSEPHCRTAVGFLFT